MCLLLILGTRAQTPLPAFGGEENIAGQQVEPTALEVPVLLVPGVVGMPLADASAAISSAGLIQGFGKRGE